MGTQSRDGHPVRNGVRRVLGYVRQQHMGLLALMIALGG
jgi:hypothetical protein